MHLEIVINPSNPAAVDSLRAGIALLREEGHTVHPHLTFEGGDARRFAREAAERGAELVVAAGGDGTINEVVNGLNDWAEADGRDELPRLAVIPLGTANDFAGGLRVPKDPEEALAVAVEGKSYPVDLAALNGRAFLNVSSGGFGAEATDEASDELKRMVGPIAYVVTGVRKFVTLHPSTARFTSGGETLHDGDFLIFAVGNARRTGGGVRLTAEADLSDGLLDLCVVEGMTHMEFVRIAPQLRAGNHVEHPKVVYKQVRSVSVEAEDELSVNVDGEPISARRFEYPMVPRQITVMAPRPPDGAEG
ncbi:MAG: YegS/Rv2252/BmrU family lipid kinase [Gemmatimonadetes bacterium]|nr:YegS/Rv2252/BmrU family lipid kinase [Gemmatimonadota bacterium]